MKKKILALICCLAFLICLLPNTAAFADPFTAFQIGAASFAAMSSWGISFTAGNASLLGMGNFMAGQVEEYVNYTGSSISEIFGSALTVDAAGKLAMGQTMYNGIIGFVDWLADKYNLSGFSTDLTQGRYGNIYIPSGKLDASVDIDPNGASVLFSNASDYGFLSVNVYQQGTLTYSYTMSYPWYYTGSWYMSVQNTSFGVFLSYANTSGQTGSQFISFGAISALSDKLTWDGTNFVQPTVIDPSYQWLGQVGDYQDTNLEQLLEHILEDVEGNNLIVEGEIVPIDPPQPVPTYVPIDPDTLLPDVPLGAIDEIIGNLGGTIEDALDEQAGELEGVIEGAIEGQTGALEGAIDEQTGAISGAIDQAISDIDSAISEQTGSITDALEGVESAVGSVELTIEDALEVPEMRKFDLRTLFPFCIPFDIARILGAFDGAASAPHVQIPIVISSINFSYNLDLDFSAFDPVAAVLRQVELIAFAVFLAYSTSKVIRW